MISKKIKIGQYIFDNRVFASPMCQYSANKNGTPGVWHYYHLSNLIMSEASALIIESTAVSKLGRITNHDLCLYNTLQKNKINNLIYFLKKFKKKNKILIQLSHSGRKGSVTVPWLGSGPLKGRQKWTTYSASNLKMGKGFPEVKKLDLKHIKKIKSDFIGSIKLAKNSALDGVELHMAHGYLLHQFISPICNNRKDKYGINYEGRTRLPLEIIKNARKILKKKI